MWSASLLWFPFAALLVIESLNYICIEMTVYFCPSVFCVDIMWQHESHRFKKRNKQTIAETFILFLNLPASYFKSSTKPKGTLYSTNNNCLQNFSISLNLFSRSIISFVFILCNFPNVVQKGLKYKDKYIEKKRGVQKTERKNGHL